MLEVRGEAAPDGRSEETGQPCQTLRQRNATSWDYEDGTIKRHEEARCLPEMWLKEGGVHPLRAAHV